MSTFDLLASHDWEHVYIVRWTDTSQGYHFSCAKRFPTQERAQTLVEKFVERERRFYSGAMAYFCPFRNVRLIQER